MLSGVGIGDKLGEIFEHVNETLTRAFDKNLDHENNSEQSENGEHESHVGELLSSIGAKIHDKLDSVLSRVEEKLDSAAEHLDRVFEKIGEHLDCDDEENNANQTLTTQSGVEEGSADFPELLESLIDDQVAELSQTLVEHVEPSEELKWLLSGLLTKDLLSESGLLSKLDEAADDLDNLSLHGLSDHLRDLREKLAALESEVESRAAELAEQFENVSAEQIAAALHERVERKLDDLFGELEGSDLSSFVSLFANSLLAGSGLV